MVHVLAGSGPGFGSEGRIYGGGRHDPHLGEEWGCITSEEEYADYHLVMEFMWGDETHGDRADRARDSGLLVHSTGEDGGYSGIWMHSIECQMIEGGTGDLLVVGDGSEDFALTCPVAPESRAVRMCSRRAEVRLRFMADGSIGGAGTGLGGREGFPGRA